MVTDVAIEVDGDFAAPGSASTPITVDVDLRGEGDLRALLDRVIEMAEIPRSVAPTTPIEIHATRLDTS